MDQSQETANGIVSILSAAPRQGLLTRWIKLSLHEHRLVVVGFPSRLFGGWRHGYLDGFLALGLDNLIQILLILGLCRTVLGYPDSLLFGVILPATGLSLLVGNVAYANQALQLARREQRDDCTALPYGINTISLLTCVFLVMLPDYALVAQERLHTRLVQTL